MSAPSSGAPDGGGYLRQVTPADLKAVAALERRCFPEPWTPMAFEQFVEAAGFLVAIQPKAASSADPAATVDGLVVGYAVTTPASTWPRQVAHVRDLAVDPAYRRNGLGARLLSASIEPYRQSGFDRVRLEVRERNDAAIGLYRGAGFAMIERRPGYYRDGEAALVMAKSLTRGDT